MSDTPNSISSRTRSHYSANPNLVTLDNAHMQNPPINHTVNQNNTIDEPQTQDITHESDTDVVSEETVTTNMASLDSVSASVQQLSTTLTDNVQQLSTAINTVKDNLGNFSTATDETLTTVTRKLTKPNIKEHGFTPESFNGDPMQDATLFLSRFDQYCSYFDKTPAQKLAIFPMLLKQRAYRWFEKVPATSKATWNLLKTAFETEYGPSSKSYIDQTTLLDRSQGLHEDVRQYATDIMQRIQLTGIEDSEAKTVFIKGLKSELKPHVLTKNPGTLKDAEKSAIEAEQLHHLQRDVIHNTVAKALATTNTSADTSSKQEKFITTLKTMQDTQKSLAQRLQNVDVELNSISLPTRAPTYPTQSQQQQYPRDRNNNRPSYSPRQQRQPHTCRVCNRTGHVANECRERTCFYCGIKGHVINDCRKKQTQEHNNQSFGQRNNNFSPQGFPSYPQRSRSLPPPSLMSTAPQNYQRRPSFNRQSLN